MSSTRALFFAAVFLAAACGDDDDPINPSYDARLPDAPLTPDAGPTFDATPPQFDAPPPLPGTNLVPLSAAGPDQLQSAVAGPSGSFYVAGYKAAAVESTSARTVVVLKVLATGALDNSFGGGDGIAETPLDHRGGTDEIDLVVQPSGKIVVSATVVDTAQPLDRDAALVRLDATGAMDNGFGVSGIRRLDWGKAVISGTPSAAAGTDAPRSLAVDADGRIYVHGVTRGAGQFNAMDRTDLDFIVVRLSVDGEPDGNFGDSGRHIEDIRGTVAPMTPSNATARGIHVLSNGNILANGYSITAGVSPGAQPVLYMLDTAGDRVPGFASGGLFHEAVLSAQTEVYNVAVHGDHVVTGGYGSESGTQHDWISLRFALDDGERDTSWGGAANGVVVFDPSGAMISDNCRSAVALPGGKTMLLGSSGPANMPAQDAVYAVLSATGQVETVVKGPFGEGNLGGDAFWSGAVSGSNAILVGWRGGGPAAMQTATMNDDAFIKILPLD